MLEPVNVSLPLVAHLLFTHLVSPILVQCLIYFQMLFRLP